MIIDASHGSPLIKPPLWAIDPGIVAQNASRMGLPMPVVGYIWGSGGLWNDTGPYFWSGDLVADAKWVIGKYGPVVEFDGMDDRVALGSSINASLVNPLTIVIRMRADATGRVSFMNRAQYNGVEGLEIFTETNKIAMRGSGITSVESVSTILGEWHVYVFIFNSTTGTIYIDGMYSNSGTIEAVTASTVGYCFIGAYGIGIGDYNHEGQIDSVIIFPTAFTPSQVATISADPYGLVRQPRMVALWAYAAAVGGVAPTGVFYGPLYGPLGGPV